MTGRVEQGCWGLRGSSFTVWISRALSPPRDYLHQFCGYSTVMRRRKAEKRSADPVELLRRERVARAEATRANRARETFLTAVSHELRTPLNAILGWAHLLATGQLRDDQTTRAGQIIERNAKAQAQLIDDLLDLSRIASGQFTVDRRPLVFSRVVEAAIEIVRPDLDAKHLQLSLSGAEEPGEIEGDVTRLQQVVLNLLANAIKFTPSRGTIAVRVRRTDRGMELTVHDTGQGISPKALAHIFDTFHGHHTPGPHGAGLGVGLAIARHILEAHSGTIVGQSEGEAQGATFTVRLPMALKRPPPRSVNAGPKAAEEECPPVLVGLCALVVEDQPDSRALLDAVLTRCGMRVIAVDSVPDALQALESHPIDVIISDIGLGREDGLTLIRRVRERPSEKGGGVPAIAVSAYGGAADRTRALAAGYQTYVSKPLVPTDVTAAMAALLR
jgi:signal transduction histidine kinase/CheY-like chemotaxis protein